MRSDILTLAWTEVKRIMEDRVASRVYDAEVTRARHGVDEGVDR